MSKIYQKLDMFTTPEAFRGQSRFIGLLWWFVQPTFFAMSPVFMFAWRRWILRIFGAEMGGSAMIRPTVKVSYPWNLKVGDHVWVGDNVELYCMGKIEIGNNAVISQKSYLCTGTHDYLKPSFDVIIENITIEDEVWIATDVFVGPGVRVGRGALIGARSSVFSDMPEGMVCFGSPAKVMGQRALADE